MYPIARYLSAGSRRTVPPFPVRAQHRSVMVGGAAALLAATVGCGTLSPEAGSEVSTEITVSSTMLVEGRPLPDAFTCVGEGVSPPLQWSGLPDDDRMESLAVVVDDPERATVFWVLYGLDPQVAEISQNSVPRSGRQGRNSSGEPGYDPPCPEESNASEYRFTVYALDGEVGLSENAPLEKSLEAIASRVIARGSLNATSE